MPPVFGKREFKAEASRSVLAVATEDIPISETETIPAGAGYASDLDVDDSDWSGSLDYEWWGPSAFIKLRF